MVRNIKRRIWKRLLQEVGHDVIKLKRESFERKAYARMTNTIFTPGTSTKEEMIATANLIIKEDI